MQIQPTPAPFPPPQPTWYPERQQYFTTRFNYWPFALFVAAVLPYAVVVGAVIQIWGYTSGSTLQSLINLQGIVTDILAIVVSMIVSQFFMVCGLMALSLLGKQK